MGSAFSLDSTTTKELARRKRRKQRRRQEKRKTAADFTVLGGGGGFSHEDASSWKESGFRCVADLLLFLFYNWYAAFFFVCPFHTRDA